MKDPRPDQMSDAELRRDVTEKRADVAADVDALATKLEPSHMRAEFKEMVHDTKERVMRRTKDGVRAHTRHVQDAVKANPWPYALVAGGVGWLLVDRYVNRAYTPRLDEGKREVRARVDSRYHDAKHHASLKLQDARIVAEHARDRGGVVARDAGAHVQGFYEDNPLAVGGIALALGVGVGLLLPASGREAALFGERSSAFRRHARDLGHELEHDVTDIARTTAKRTAETAQQTAKETARSEAHSHGLDDPRAKLGMKPTPDASQRDDQNGGPTSSHNW